MSGATAKIIKLEAAARSRIHENHASRRVLSENYDEIGLAGEVEFGREFGLPVNWHRAPDGDGGIDFILPIAYTVDVKTFDKAYHLIQEIGKLKAHIYVLAEYLGDAQARLVGWEWGRILGQAPVKDFGYGIDTHYIHRDQLRSIKSLQERVMRLTCG